MSDQPKTADIPVGPGDLEMAQDEIQTAQQELDRLLEQMKQALDDGKAIEPRLFQEAAEQAKELEIEASSLQKDLEKLQKQQSAH
jgi:chromosome segregation ATPase